MVPRRGDSPHVPLDPQDIAEQVGEAAAVGVTVVHLHARDADGTPTHDPAVFARIIEAIRASYPDLVICVSLRGRHRSDFESRAAPQQLTGSVKPDMASLTLASMNFSRDASITPEMVGRLAREMLARGVAPELEVFDTGMVNYARQADPLSLGTMLAMLLKPSLWAAVGIGRSQTAAHALALAAGGGVRTGLEDNLFLDRARTTPATNLQLVRGVHELAAVLERFVMTPAEFRQRMNLGAGHGSYGRNHAEPSEGA